MSAHSPAPWKFVPPGGTNEYCDEGEDQGGFYDANGECVCWFGDGSTYYPSDGEAPGEVDARLIVAAPELLDALVDALCSLEVCGRNFDHVMGKARSAIAKARGES